MCKLIKRLFAKNVDVVVNKNFVTCSGYTSNGKVKVGDTFYGVVTPLENYTIDFVTVYRNKISFFTPVFLAQKKRKPFAFPRMGIRKISVF